MSAAGTHPHLLPWYAAGTLEAPDELQVDCHVQACAPCREESVRLASLGRSLVAQSRLDHIPAERLVLCAEGAAAFGEGDRGHLAECAACRDDLTALREADSARPESALHRAPARRRAWVAAGAAAALALAVLSIRPDSPVRPEPRPPSSMTRVVFPAPVRGGGMATILRGLGPWRAVILLPLGSPGVTREVSVRGHGLDRSLPARPVTPDSAGRMALEIPAGLPGGRHELIVHRQREAGAPELTYPFEVLQDIAVPDASSPPAPNP